MPHLQITKIHIYIPAPLKDIEIYETDLANFQTKPYTYIAKLIIITIPPKTQDYTILLKGSSITYKKRSNDKSIA